MHAIKVVFTYIGVHPEYLTLSYNLEANSPRGINSIKWIESVYATIYYLCLFDYFDYLNHKLSLTEVYLFQIDRSYCVGGGF